MVELRYREMHDDVDVFLTGIPMEYDSAGRQQLETAGMFELRGSQNGQDVFVKQGVKLEVRLASFTGDRDYMAYYLDEKARNWKYLEYNRPEVNEEKVKFSQKLTEMEKMLTNPIYKKNFVLDYVGLLDVLYDNRVYSQDIDNDMVKAKIKEYGLGWVDADGYDYIIFNKSYEPVSMMVWKGLENKILPSWLKPRVLPKGKMKATFESLYVKNQSQVRAKALGGNNYQLTFYRISGPEGNTNIIDSFKLKAEAVMTLYELFKFPASKWKNDYSATMAELEKERERMATIADAFRTLEVEGFGIYNYDRLTKQENVVAQASFRYEKAFEEQGLAVEEVWVVPSGERSVVKWERNMWSALPIPVKLDAKILAALPGNRLAVFTADQFAAIDIESLRKSDKPQFTFDMHVAPNPMASKEDIVKAIRGD